MDKYTVYCAHPISGMTWDEVFNYYEDIKSVLNKMGFNVLHPMTGKSSIRTEINERFKPAGYSSKKNKIASNHAIFERDKWMVQNCDILYLDLSNNNGTPSIGCMMELAWASLLGKYVVTVMPEEDTHRHAFVIEASDVIFEDKQEALDYLEVFINQKI